MNMQEMAMEPALKATELMYSGRMAMRYLIVCLKLLVPVPLWLYIISYVTVVFANIIMEIVTDIAWVAVTSLVAQAM